MLDMSLERERERALMLMSTWSVCWGPCQPQAVNGKLNINAKWITRDCYYLSNKVIIQPDTYTNRKVKMSCDYKLQGRQFDTG